MSDDMFSIDAVLSKHVKKPVPNAKPREILLYSKPGSGKGLIHGTPVMTPEGYTPVEKLEVGDLVIGSDGRPTRIYGIWDRGEQDVFLVSFTDGTSVVTDGDHLWSVQQKVTDYWMVMSTRQIMSRVGGKRRKFCHIPTVAPVEHTKKDLPIPPYALGAFLADGYLHGAAIQYTKNDQAVVDRVSQDVPLREVTRETSTARQWKPEDTIGVRSSIQSLGIDVSSSEKFIPEMYLYSDIEDRWNLLHGLFDGDGSYRKSRGTAMYHSVSRRLVDDVALLCRSLGIPVRVGDYVTSDGTWRLTILDGTNPFSECDHYSEFDSTKPHPYFRNGIEKIIPYGRQETRCLAVEAKDQLFVTSNYIVTHNTHLAGTAVDLPTVKKGLYIDTEGSTEGVIKNPKWDILKVYEYPSAERIEQLAKARKVDPSEIDQREERFKFFNTILGNGKNGLFNRANKTSYDVIVVDTLDVAQDWAQDYFLDGPGAHLTRSGEVDTRAGWRNISKWSEDLANGLNEHPSLSILVAHNKETQSESGAVTNGIRLSGSAKDTLPGIPGLVLYLERVVEDDVSVVYATTGTDNRKVTKDRFNLPTTMKNPTIPAIFKYIDKNNKETE